VIVDSSSGHPAAVQRARLPLVFTAHSAETSYLKELICAFALQRGCVPVNPFMSYGYFLFGLVDKDTVRRANNNLVARCDELWVFGEPSDGVQVEVALAIELGLPVRTFEMDHYGSGIVERQSSLPTTRRHVASGPA
jgi:hypothetical protein